MIMLHSSYCVSDFMSACYATMTPKEELIEIMKQVDRDAPNLKPNPFCPREMPLERRGATMELWMLHGTRSNATVRWMT